MSNEVFPVLQGLAWGVKKTPRFTTRIQRSSSGREARAGFNSYPVYRFSMHYDVLEEDRLDNDIETLHGFFLRHRGAMDSFLFTDTSDSKCVSQAVGVGDGARKSFQLVRTYGGFTEPVFNANTVDRVTINGVATTAYTLGSNGVIAFTAPPPIAAAIAWSGSYYFRCRFESDDAEFEQFMHRLWTFKKCDLVGSLGDKI